jgi:hypothetical protein
MTTATHTKRSGPENIDVSLVAAKWLQAFAAGVEGGDVDSVVTLLNGEDAGWRDVLSLTWDFRTFQGSAKIKVFLEDRLKAANLKKFTLINAIPVAGLVPDVAWVQGLFEFEVGDLGQGNGVFRIVQIPTGEWRVNILVPGCR